MKAQNSRSGLFCGQGWMIGSLKQWERVLGQWEPLEDRLNTSAVEEGSRLQGGTDQLGALGTIEESFRRYH
jgi:hypothetical protein